jgi:hypothetical protein
LTAGFRTNEAKGDSLMPVKMDAFDANTTVGRLLLAIAVGNAPSIGRRFGLALSVAAAVLPGICAGANTPQYTYQKISTLATPCTPAPLISPTDSRVYFQFDFEPWGINNRGDLAFAADFTSRSDLPCGSGLSSEGEGAFYQRNGELFQIPRGGLPAPGVSGRTLTYGVYAFTSINEASEVAFVFGLVPTADLETFPSTVLYRFSGQTKTLTPVVIPGVTPAPGFGLFQSTGQHASLNNRGDIAFPGVVRTSAGTTQDFGQGIFMVDRHGQISKVVAPGDPAPGGSQFDLTYDPWMNDSGDIAFGGHVASDPCIQIFGPGFFCALSTYVWHANTGVIESIAHQGGAAPGGGIFHWAWGPIMNNNGDIVFMGELNPSVVRGIYLHSKGTTVPIARPGDAMPGGGADRRSIANSRQLFHQQSRRYQLHCCSK